jgi:ABC-type nitrate/sulfonate/bicarbonate transport system substrate-binding protein
MDPEKDATFLPTGVQATTVAALASGQVDAALTWEPGLALGQIQGIATSPFSLRAGDGPDVLHAPGLLFVAKRDYIKNNREVIQGFVDSIADAITWLRNPKNQDELLQMMQSTFNMPADVAKQVLEGESKQWADNPADVDTKSLGKAADYLYKNGVTKQKHSVDDFVLRIDK